MTIKQAVFEFTSKILTSEYKKLIKDIINEIEDDNIQTKEGNNLPKSKLGKIIRNQSARNANIQFYGYLLAHQRKDEIEKELDCTVPSLTEKQVSTLQDIHNEILYLNYKCIENLPRQLKHHYAINPYFEYNGHVLKNKYSPFIFDHEEIQKLKNTFSQHKGFKLIEKIDNSDFNELNKINTERLVGGIIAFEKSIIKAGVKRSPKDLEDTFKKQLKLSAKTPVLYMIALLCIKESLKNINQLIYQSFIHNKLLSIDKNNIINYSSSSHYIGEGFIVETQLLPVSNPAQIVIFIEPHRNDTVFCRLEKNIYSFSKEIGQVSKLYLRKLDDDLNPFYNLVKETLQVV